MTRRRWVCLGVAAVLALGVGVWFFWPVSPAIRAYERIRLGMTREQVEAVIGGPPTAHKFGFHVYPSGSGRALFVPFSGPMVREAGVPFDYLSPERWLDGWQWDDYELWVTYNPDEQLVGCYLMETLPSGPDFFDRIRAWLGL